MKKLITILGAGLLAFGMFTSCGAKDVNLSWSDEATTYEYTCDVTAGTVSEIDEPSSYDVELARKNATSTTTNVYTIKYATVKWEEGYAGKDASKDEGNVDEYTVKLYYELETTTTVNATGNITSHSVTRPTTPYTLEFKKVGDKYFVNYGKDNQAEVTIDGDPTDDEFTFSVESYSISYEPDWKADGSANYLKGDTVRAERAVRSGKSLSNVTLVRK